MESNEAVIFTTDDIYGGHEDELKRLKDVFIEKFASILKDLDITIHYMILSYKQTANITDEDSFIISIDGKYGSIQFAKYGRKKMILNGVKDVFKLTRSVVKSTLGHREFTKFGFKVTDGVLHKVASKSKGCVKFLKDKTVINYGRINKIKMILED